MCPYVVCSKLLDVPAMINGQCQGGPGSVLIMYNHGAGRGLGGGYENVRGSQGYIFMARS